MPNNKTIHSLLSLLVFTAPALAAWDRSDEAFRRSLRLQPGTVTAPVPVPAPARDLSTEAGIAAQLDEWLGVYQSFLPGPALDAAAMSKEVTDGLASGLYKGVVLGESHGIQAETDSGVRIVKDVLASHGIGAFSRERETFQDAGFLQEAGVPVLTFKNQFKPDPDVQAGFAAARGDLLVTYTGHVHTSVQLKNYFVFTLLEGKPFGYFPGGKDMPTVEESFLAGKKKPVIVAMLTENRVLRRVEQLFLRAFVPAEGISGADYLRKLKTLGALWDDKVLSAPSHPGPIYFARSPKQPNLFAGITPGERKAVAVNAVITALELPACVAWLGSDPIKLVESLWGSDENGVSWRVVVRKFSGETFEHTVRL